MHTMSMLALLPCVLTLAVEPPSPGTVDLDADRSRPPPLRIITHAGAGPWLVQPTEHESGKLAPGLATEVDVGVQRGSWVWTGILGGWGFYPSKDMSGHQVTGGVFFGVRPQVGRLWLSSRIGASAGVVIGRSPAELATRPVAVGHLRVGLETYAALARQVRFGFYLGLDVNSRETSFLTDTGDGIGLGRVRGGVLATVAWDVAVGPGS